MFNKKSIGRSLQAARKSAGFKSAKSFAEHMGYNVGTYTDWEQGLHLFSFEQAWEMADALGCTLDELGGRTPPRSDARDALSDSDAALLRACSRLDARDRAAVLQLAHTLSGGAAEVGEVGVA